MTDGLQAILDQADGALALALRVSSEDDLARAKSIAGRLRNRHDFPDDLYLVALIGGTGSGKSSLFNALLDTDDAEIGGVRPTTVTPLASIPTGRASEIERYIQWVGEVETTSHDDPPDTVLIDLPDTDSVVIAHRETVEEVLAHADVVVWVVDIEKYRDEALHSRFLRKLTSEEDRFVFVLNQVDRLPDTEWEIIVVDFKTSLLEDGFTSPVVVATAARPPAGPAFAVDELREAIAAVTAGSVTRKVDVDLQALLGELAAAVGSSSTEFERRWADLLPELTSQIEGGDVLGAGRGAARFLAELAAELAGEASNVAAHMSAVIGERIRVIAGNHVGGGLGREARLAPVEAADDAGSKSGGPGMQVQASLDALLDETLRPALRQRGEAVAALSELSTSIENWRRRQVH